ncbi:MAG: pectinesterase family protein, partial [Desulfobulbaceae bacterium]|nr:pectinesterase family protein [Desulfobulbaceae bacterium]
MRNCMYFIVVLMGVLFVSQAVAADKVVVIPLNSAKKLMNVVTVSAKGGDYTNPVAAVNSITDAAADNPYMVFIGPGVYTLTQTLVMKPFVTISGAGQDATTLTGAISSGTVAASTIVSGADNATLCDLTIENTGGSTASIALYNDNSSPVIHDVTAHASGGDGNVGVMNVNSSKPTMIDMTVIASGGSECYGVSNNSSSQVYMAGVMAKASGGTDNYGARIAGSSAMLIKHSEI